MEPILFFYVSWNVCFFLRWTLVTHSFSYKSLTQQLFTQTNSYRSFSPNWISSTEYISRDSEGIKVFDISDKSEELLVTNSLYVSYTLKRRQRKIMKKNFICFFFFSSSSSFSSFSSSFHRKAQVPTDTRYQLTATISWPELHTSSSGGAPTTPHILCMKSARKSGIWCLLQNKSGERKVEKKLAAERLSSTIEVNKNSLKSCCFKSQLSRTNKHTHIHTYTRTHTHTRTHAHTRTNIVKTSCLDRVETKPSISSGHHLDTASCG